MARGNSIHFAKGGAGYFSHNDRTTETKNSIFSDEKNEYSCSSKEAFSIYRKELQIRSQAYSKRTNQKLQKNAITHRSAILNLEAHHTLNDLKPILEKIENDLDTKILQVAIHRDEGHIDTDGKPIINYHAHIEIMGLDSLGFSIAQYQKKNKAKKAKDFKETRTIRLDTNFYKDMQDFTSKVLQMERGINYSKEKKPMPKRLDTYEYKEHAKKQAKTVQEVKLTVSQLKSDIELFKKEMSSAKIFTKEDYKELSSLKKKIKSKNVLEMYQEFIKLQEQYRNRIDEMKHQLEQKELEIITLRKELEEKPKVIEKEVIKEVVKTVENPINTRLEKEISVLKENNNVFKDDIKELQKENDELISENYSLHSERSDLRTALQDISDKISKHLPKEIQLSIEFLSKSTLEKVEIFLQQAIKSINSYKSKIKIQEKQLKERFTNSSDRQEIRKSKNENERLEAELKASKLKIEALKEQISTLEAQKSTKEGKSIPKSEKSVPREDMSYTELAKLANKEAEDEDEDISWGMRM